MSPLAARKNKAETQPSGLTVIVTEKPDAATRIAGALAERPRKVPSRGAYWYEFERGGRKFIVVPAVGHLIALDTVKDKSGWGYPTFATRWIPAYEKKGGEFSERYYRNMADVLAASPSAEVIVATDYDTEGCLPEFEKILVKDAGITKLIKIGEFVNGKLTNAKKSGEFEYSEIEGDAGIAGINFPKWGNEFIKIKKVMKRKGDGHLLRITLECGRSMNASENHPFFTITSSGMNVVHGKKLRIGDYLPVLKELPYSDMAIKEIDLIERFKDENVYVYGFRQFIDKMPAEMSKITGAKRKTCLGWRFFDRIPVWAYLKLEQEPSGRRNLKIGVKRSKTKIPAVVRLSPKLGRLLGYYLAEGCVDSSGFVGFYFGPHEKNLVDEVRDIFKRELGMKNIKNRMMSHKTSFGKEVKGGYKSPEIGTKSKIFRMLLEKVFDLGRGSHEKRLPNFILSTPVEFCTNLIDAYLVGDGCAFLDKDGRCVTSAGSVSEELLSDMHLLLLRFGINSLLCSDREKAKHYLTVGSKDELKKMLKLGISSQLEKAGIANKITKTSDYKIRNPLNLVPNFMLDGCELTTSATHNKNYSQRTSLQSIVEMSEFVGKVVSNHIHFLRIVKIEELDYHGDFYDVETESSSFMAGDGIVSHNSVIGYNIVSHIAGRSDAGRMKFSTLTKDELVEAFEKRAPGMDMGQVESGLTRHYLDFYWGINMTRALTTAVKHANEHGFALLSTGRVQGPTLAMLMEREAAIRAFAPKPFWQVEAGLEKDGRTFTASYERDIWDEDEAKRVRDDCSRAGTRADVTSVDKRKYSQAPPVPFNTTDLQAESYEHFHYSPKQTLAIVEELYQAGAVSYPRSSSQKLPPAIGYNKIISALSKLSTYKTLANALAKKKELIPNEGSKTDPAHPAIYPTAETPDTRKLSTAQKNLYDMIVRRFMAVFADAALRETTTATFDIAGHAFKAAGHATLEQGWTKFAGKYANLEEDTLPELRDGEQLFVKTVALLAKKTQPPQRFTQASVLRAMEDKELGTRATRAEILQTLYDRNYITGRSIEVTKLGEAVTSVLKEYSPRIVSEELTRRFEEEMEAVQSGGKKRDEVLEEAKAILTELLIGFKQNEPEIGSKLLEGVQQARAAEQAFGKCPKCGSDLRVIVSKATKKRFMGCSGYPACNNSFPLPQKGALRKAGADCKCGLPMILIFGRGRRPYRACIDPACRSR